MARFCTSCGREVQAGLRYCPECGAEQSPVPASQAAPADPAKVGKVVSTGAFWGLSLLYALPGVGFICSIVLSLVSENKNVRHHALAALIWKLIGILLLALLFLLARPAIRRASEDFRDYFREHGSLSGEVDPRDVLGRLESGDLQGFLEEYGDDLQDLLEEYGGDLRDLPEEYGAEADPRHYGG